jgi:sec-independent protein translocase protein TatA
MGNLGPTEIILILLVLVLLFGAKKLPELARGSGRALRIFKAETKGLMDDDDEKFKTEEQRQIDAQRPADPVRYEQPQHPQQQAQPQPGPSAMPPSGPSDTDR